MEKVTKDKAKLERRVVELEQSLEQAKKDMEQLQGLSDYKSRVQSLEKEVSRLKHTLEVECSVLSHVFIQLSVSQLKKCGFYCGEWPLISVINTLKNQMIVYFLFLLSPLGSIG